MKFKLSRGLAVLPSLLLTATAVATGCVNNNILDPSLPLAGIITQPQEVTLAPNDTQSFLARGITLTGDTVGVEVAWSATGGTINASGVFTAAEEQGEYQVVARSTGSKKLTSSSSVKVEVPLSQLVISPSTVSLEPGGTQQFAAYGWRQGDSVAVSVTYTATGGVIASDGLFSAGSATGSYHVIATATADALADTAAVTIASVPVASVDVTPDPATVVAGQALQLTATPRDASGNALSGRVVSWSSSDAGVAAVDNTGLVSGVAAGSATITATSEGQSGTATLTVTPVPVGSVDVTPDPATVVAGQAVQLTVIPRDAAGNALSGRSVTWRSSDGAVATVDNTGLVAGIAAGSATITAAVEGHGGTAAVTVTPEPPSGVSECATPQAAWIWCDDFEQDRLGQYFEYKTAGGAFVRATNVGLDSSHGMRASWSTGQVSAGALHLAFGKTPQAYFSPVDAGTEIYRNLYWRLYLRNEPGWIGGGGNKLTRATSFASTTSWAQAMIAHVWSGSTSKKDFLVIDPASGTDQAGNLKTTSYNDFANLRWLGAVSGTTPLFDAAHIGQWYCVETHVMLNDAGASNGVFELWIDGNLEAQKTGMNWVGDFSQYGINAVFFENYWNAGAPQAQERYFDNIVVSTEPVGCR